MKIYFVTANDASSFKECAVSLKEDAEKLVEFMNACSKEASSDVVFSVQEKELFLNFQEWTEFMGDDLKSMLGRLGKDHPIYKMFKKFFRED
jgi:hypothetical protein